MGENKICNWTRQDMARQTDSGRTQGTHSTTNPHRTANTRKINRVQTRQEMREDRWGK